jgi:hypothetical protein
MKQITKFDPKNCEQVRVAVNEALADIGKKFGIKIGTGRGKYRDMHFTLTVEASVVGEGGIDLSDKVDFVQYAVAFGLRPDMFGKTFKANGEEYRIVGLNLKANKMPVKCVRVSDGRDFKFATKALVAQFSVGAA